MVYYWKIWIIFIVTTCYQSSSTLIGPKLEKSADIRDSDSKDQYLALDSTPRKSQFDPSLNSADAQESANFFTSDLGGYSSPTDYSSFFDSYPGLSYFPEFGEIFRISKTTTPQPPFEFPDYAREAFSDRIREKAPGGSTGSTISGGRRPSRRPPRPASSGTRTKVTKHNQSEPKEKTRTLKSKSVNKSRNYPKIFRFNPDRVNLADFDTKKKINENYLTLVKGDELDFDKVKRNKFLILHGGVFEIERTRKRGLFHASTNSHSDVMSLDDSIYGFSSNPSSDKLELENVQYVYKA